MAGEYQQFLDFDWSDDKWQQYLSGLYPVPKGKLLLKYKKKWYKRNIDPDFDDTHEPAAQEPSPHSDAAASAEGGEVGGEAGAPRDAGNSSSREPLSSLPSAVFSDGSRWAAMGQKTMICFSAYVVALTLAVGSVAAVFPPWQSLMVLSGSFILELLAKYGLKFKTEYIHAVLLDDVGIMPMMALTLLTPGLHPIVQVFSLTSPFLTALMSFAQICSAYSRLRASVREFFEPLAAPHARQKVMQFRADMEVLLGFVLVAAVLTVRAAPISALLYWNLMMMRYIMSGFTQDAFKKIDDALSPTLGRTPVVKLGYGFVKRNMYGFVDPESRRAGHMCTIM